jgi:hypothetical protein
MNGPFVVRELTKSVDVPGYLLETDDDEEDEDGDELTKNEDSLVDSGQ